MFAARNLLLTSPRPVVAFDAVGAGAEVHQASPAPSWAHQLAPGARGLLTVFHVWTSGSTATAWYSSATATVGGVSMPQLSAWNYNAGDSHLLVFGLIGPPTGAQTPSISLAPPSGANTYVTANSSSFLGVSTFGTPVTATGTTGTCAQTVNAAGVPWVFNVMASTSGQNFSAYNRNLRFSIFTSGLAPATLIGDSVGNNASLGFSATTGAIAWGTLAIPLS